MDLLRYPQHHTLYHVSAATNIETLQITNLHNKISKMRYKFPFSQSILVFVVLFLQLLHSIPTYGYRPNLSNNIVVSMLIIFLYEWRN